MPNEASVVSVPPESTGAAVVSDEGLSLDEQQSALTEEYLALRDEAEGDSKAKRKLSRLEKKLDAIYWKRVEELLAGRVDPDRDEIAFSGEERLLIDFGLLDTALVKDADDGLIERLFAELSIPGEANHFYLSEWIEDRFRRYLLTREVASAEEDEAEEQNQFHMARKTAFSKLSSLFEGLPGVPRELASQVVGGVLDEQILRMDIALMDNHARRLFLSRRRLYNLRSQVMEKARARVRDQASLKLFDAIDEIYARDWKGRYVDYDEAKKKAIEDAAKGASGVMAALRSEEKEKVVSYLLSELRFVKTLFPIGALAGGMTRTCAVLLQDKPRVTKRDTSEVMSLAQICDRGFAVNPVVLLAPFTGRGIFEWDRDSMVIGLVPVEGGEDSVANAVGNYRMLIDSLQNEGQLKKAYAENVSDGNFQEQFQADYRRWISLVGHGKVEGVSENAFAFFRERVGPDCSAVLAPPKLRRIGPAARKSVIKRLKKEIESSSTPDANLHHRLAVLNWQEGELEEALVQMAMAAKLAPKDGDILFSLGLIIRAKGDTERALGIFRACGARVPDSIWAVYAREALEGRV